MPLKDFAAPTAKVIQAVCEGNDGDAAPDDEDYETLEEEEEKTASAKSDRPQRIRVRRKKRPKKQGKLPPPLVLKANEQFVGPEPVDDDFRRTTVQPLKACCDGES